MSVEHFDVKARAMDDFTEALANHTLVAMDSTPTELVPTALKRLFGAVMIDAAQLPEFPYRRAVIRNDDELVVEANSPFDNARRYVEEAFTFRDESTNDEIGQSELSLGIGLDDPDVAGGDISRGGVLPSGLRNRRVN